jgi:hypothetical protein
MNIKRNLHITPDGEDYRSDDGNHLAICASFVKRRLGQTPFKIAVTLSKTPLSGGIQLVRHPEYGCDAADDNGSIHYLYTYATNRLNELGVSEGEEFYIQINTV